jgi:putative tricarboxylic transport membrane protein
VNERATSGRVGEQRPGEETGETRVDEVSSEARPAATSRSLLLSMVPEVLLLVAAVYLFVVAGNFRQVGNPDQISPGFWPQMLSVGIVIGTLVRIGQKFRTRKRPIAGGAVTEAEEDTRMPRVALGIALVVGYLVGILFLGYILATALFLITFIYLGGQRKWYVVIPLGLVTSVVFAYVFLKVVYIALPSGVGVFDQLSVILYQLLGIY